jgi:hypothetical protein
MAKWLAALGAIVLVLIVLLWRELDSSDAAPEVKPAKPEPAQVAQAPEAKPAARPAEGAAKPAEPAAQADRSKEKMDPQSDEFFYYHDELVPQKLMREAVKCWENVPPARRAEFHRNQDMTVTFKQKIRNGVVTIHDLVVTQSKLKDAALEACFVQHLRATTWTNPRLPDWDQEDELSLGPRTLKKHTRENIDFVGPEAPRD